MKERSLPRWVYGVIAFAVSLCGWLLLFALTRSSSTWDTYAWVLAGWYAVAIPFAVRGFPSWTSVVTLVVLVFFLYGNSERVISAQFQSVAWLALAASSVVLLRRGAGVPSVLLVVGSVGGVVLSGLYAFREYTLDYGVLDGPIWAHWSLETLAGAAGVAVICFPVGMVWLSLRHTRPHLTNRSSRPLPDE